MLMSTFAFSDWSFAVAALACLSSVSDGSSARAASGAAAIRARLAEVSSLAHKLVLRIASSFARGPGLRRTRAALRPRRKTLGGKHAFLPRVCYSQIPRDAVM